jgi:Fic-DOC domain mobile mystery protein B
LSDHLFDATDGETPLAAEEREGLIPSHVTLRRELNELEQQNILEAYTWASSRRRDVFNEAFGRSLHRHMYGKVWRWAGRYRVSDKNIGIEHWRIPARIPEVLGDTRYWVEHETYPPDESAVRFHHALVLVHPFPNGNGRWSRLMADLLATRLGRARFSWGRSELREPGGVRQSYIQALRDADGHDMTALLAFARS